MYETTFEGGLVACLNRPVTPALTAYETHLNEAWAAYDAELTRNYPGVKDHG